MKFKILCVLLLSGLTACAQIPTKEEVEKTGESAEQEDISQLNLPKQELTAPILFDFLVGETALQRGNLDIAVSRYVKLSKATRDPRIAKRATEIALHAGNPFAAEQAAAMWVELEPDSTDARQTIAALLVNMGNLDAARPHLEKLLASEKDSIGNAFMQLNQLLSRNTDKVATLQLIQRLSQPYKDVPEVHFAISQAAWFANQHPLAAEEMQRALTLRPGWEIAAVHNGRILQRISSTDASEFYRDYLNKYPAANEVRIAYTRVLIGDNHTDLAREQLQWLSEKNPEDTEITLAVGLLATEMGDFDITETSFKKALSLGYKDTNAVHFHLGQIYEETNRPDMAMASYQMVKSGGRYLPAQIRYADLLALKGHLKEAREHLQKLPAANDQQTAHLILAEAQILRRSKAHREVFDLLNDGLKKLPDYPELLYDRALAADKLGKFSILEQDLRKLIKLKPDNAHAYNALGYSLAERGAQLPEALKLIRKAVELSPEDPYIMDSLGWVYYRMGNFVEGLNYLNLAFAARPDPEIAAHLGEVLWAKGAKDNAKDIWRHALEKDPENDVLLETLQRLLKKKTID
ncbi:MAG: tetratricopeptide repeat protein [Nitrosomonas sp.]|uniref:tetratricopeptide repeat protein n=1 Tax=Nitrosomonas sp. TaxID=42353 RepID=UPI00272F159E|nr:tetratricopeptide repeat protein [Nitrosomonas sp.]MDP1787838.1 tetratricopeptide repeat protein [Nitrosomonas sp.]MDP1934071.1 tetratricopeptide repeat protein [Nitrosomonas sp.]MDP2225031.1 tetratricopeptide repeat protein [Nitrosomonas sp.]MDP3279889.1 tetratricopeptide repeat protein [Nitrosomonas sp.]MDP3661946.1 tetratricopeptide repeat protein [Nitrosomonas sp.]